MVHLFMDRPLFLEVGCLKIKGVSDSVCSDVQCMYCLDDELEKMCHSPHTPCMVYLPAFACILGYLLIRSYKISKLCGQLVQCRITSSSAQAATVSYGDFVECGSEEAAAQVLSTVAKPVQLEPFIKMTQRCTRFLSPTGLIVAGHGAFRRAKDRFTTAKLKSRFPMFVCLLVQVP